MTREEASNILDDFDVNFAGHTAEEIAEAFDVAFKALSQEPCDDVISRDAVLEGIEELKKSPWATANRSHGYEYLITEALDVVADLCVKQEPSVTQKSGKWIKKEDDTCWWYACSKCEQEPLKNRWNDDDVLSAYCPNCGAKMESEDKE